MLKGHNIVCFSNDWDQDPLSKHHIMGRLAKQNRILWIDSLGLRRPTVSRQDLKKVGVKVKDFMKRLRRVQENLYVLSPLVIPFHQSAVVGKMNKGLLLLQVRNCQQRLGLDRPILWTFVPNAQRMIGALGEKLSLYYLTDDFTRFTGYPSLAVAGMEAELFEKCDAVISSAKRLAETKAGNGKGIKVVSHGVNYDHFAKAMAFGRVDWPEDIKDIEHPIIGFYGEINDWLDLKTIARVAEAKKEWSFVLLGRIAVEVGNINYLTRLPNVHWLGQKKFEELPGYCSAFDVALIPMKLNELTLSVNPLKLREYLAAGVPVVSAPLPEVLPYGDVCKFAATTEEYLVQIDAWLKQGKKEIAPVLSRRVSHETWDAKVEEISDIIEQALISKGAA
jgi:glycosyltransferase involved in cell wall biosynthesis